MYHFLMPFPSICVLDGNFSFLTLLYRMVDTLSNGVPLCLSSQLLKFTSQNLINTTQGERQLGKLQQHTSMEEQLTEAAGSGYLGRELEVNFCLICEALLHLRPRFSQGAATRSRLSASQTVTDV